jgi:DNA-binding transcriptional LysR family regulator
VAPVSDSFTIDVRRLRVLAELRQRGTVTATAAALHLTPSAVSQQLATLAREAGVPLLVRAGRGVRLTQQAHLLLEHATAVQAQLERARADLLAFEEGDVGRVAIGAFATAIDRLVAPALAALRQERPGLEIVVHETQAPDCFSDLDRGRLDMVVTVDYRDGPAHGDPRYHRRHLLVDAFDAALPVSHPLAGGPPLELSRLADEPWVLGASGPCAEVSLGACMAAGFTPAVRHRTNDWGALFALVAAGAGVAVVPQLAAPTHTDGVALRRLADPAPARHVYAAVRAGADHGPTVQPVLAMLQRVADAGAAGARRSSAVGPPTTSITSPAPRQLGDTTSAGHGTASPRTRRRPSRASG